MVTVIGRIEAVINVDTYIVQPFDVPVGDRVNEWPPPPAMLFLVKDVAEALTAGSVVWSNGGRLKTLRVDRRGMATVDSGGDRYIYVLYPARFSDEPYDPPVYVGVWPD